VTAERGVEVTDAELLEQCRAGDDGAFEVIFRRHGPAVYAFLLRMTGDPATAVDLRQEAFVRLWRARDRWAGQANARAFLIHAARALIVDSRRRAAVRTRHRVSAGESLHSSPPAPDELLRREELSRRIEQAIDSLPPRQREVFVMKRDAALSYREIGELLSISPKTVEVHMVGALRTLRKSLYDLRETG
jgi:RNA polymerase sigma-70 factor (family 1)